LDIMRGIAVLEAIMKICRKVASVVRKVVASGDLSVWTRKDKGEERGMLCSWMFGLCDDDDGKRGRERAD